jgi:antirestriction protein ArdC
MRSDAPTSRQAIYDAVTAKILTALEADPGNPRMPWQRGDACPALPTNAITGQPYRGANILSLWVTGLERGDSSGQWATQRQWTAKGARVRTGETASPIVFYKLCGRPHNL